MWRAGATYKLGVEVSSTAVTRVYAGDEELRAARGHQGFCEVACAVPIRVCSETTETGASEEKVIEPETVMLFKLGAADVGRQVRRVSHGTYLLMLPNRWSLSPGSVASRMKVSAEGYGGWLFTYDSGMEAPVVCRSDGKKESLRVEDAFSLSPPDFSSQLDRRGFYFASPPVIRFGFPLTDKMTVVIGEEGRARSRSRRLGFEVEPGAVEVPLEASFTGVSGGWFFVRVYDHDGVLLDSDQFVYLRDVTALSISGYDALPGATGHQVTNIRIAHSSVVTVEASPAECSTSPDGTILSVPPDPHVDLVDIQLRVAGGVHAAVQLSLGHIWFQFGEGKEPHEDAWTDRPAGLKIDDFRSSGCRTMHVRVPQRSGPSRLSVGFGAGRLLSLSLPESKRNVLIPLHDLFADVHARRESGQPLELRLSLDGYPGSCVVAVVDPTSPTETLAAWGRHKNATAKASLWTCGAGRVRCDGYEFDRRHPTVDISCSLLSKALGLMSACPLPPGTDLLVTTYSKENRTVRRSKAAAHAIAGILISVDPSRLSSLKDAGLGRVQTNEKLGQRVPG